MINVIQVCVKWAAFCLQLFLLNRWTLIFAQKGRHIEKGVVARVTCHKVFNAKPTFVDLNVSAIVNPDVSFSEKFNFFLAGQNSHHRRADLGVEVLCKGSQILD